MMKAPALLASIGLVVLVAALLASAKSGNEARVLRQEMAALEHAAAVPAAKPEPSVAPSPAPEPLSEAERLELLRLRGQITRLRAEARAAEVAWEQNAQLKERLAAAKANPGAPNAALPPGYILRRTARNAGQATVEATLETFLWALQHRDTNVLTQTLTPEIAEKLAEEMRRSGEDFWQAAGKLPGMRIHEQQLLPDGSMRLKLGFDVEGEADAQTTKARLVDGRWRLELR